MAVTSLPRINQQLLAAQALVGVNPYTILIVGQIGSSGSAVSGDLYVDIERKTITEIETLFGVDELTGRILRCRANIQGRVPINVIALTENGAATNATLDIVVGGAATEDGTLTLKCIDAENFTISVDVLNTDTAAVIAAAIKAEIDALERFPATAGAVAVSTVPLTANDGGTIPNKFTVKAVTEVAGVTVAAGQFTTGSNDPVTTGIFDNVQAKRFHAISWPWESDFSEVESFLEPRNIINNAFLHGCAFIGFDDTEANITAKVNGGTPLNSMNLIFMGNRQISGESVIVTPSDWRVAEFISIEGLRLTDNVPIGSFVTVTSRLDVFGNVGLSSLAYYNTPMALTDIADPDLLFDGTEQNNLKADGFSIIGVNQSKTSAIMAEVVSTYKFDVLGNPNNSFKYLNYIRTGYASLEIYYNTLKRVYSQFRLVEKELTNGRSVANEESIRGQYIRIFQILGSEDFILCQRGSEANTYFNDNLSISVDIQNGLVTSAGDLPIVTQLRQINQTWQLAFSIGG
jgi:phage tail sheath gpL-like